MSPPPPPLKASKVLHMWTKVQFAEVTLLGTCVLLPEQWLNLVCILSKYPLDSLADIQLVEIFLDFLVAFRLKN